MKLVLWLLFEFIFVLLVVVTARSLRVGLPSASPGFAASPRAMATRYDASLGLLTFFGWPAWRERAHGVKIFCLVFVRAAGNIAVSLLALIQPCELKPEESASALLPPKTA
jgi:hypothetical protein